MDSMPTAIVDMEACARNARAGGEGMQAANRKTREAHSEWIESALLAAEALHAARRELKHDTAFGQWCEANRLGFDLFSKDERAALIKIGADLPYWRETLAKTESRSLRLIVQKEPPPQGIATAAIPPRHTTKPGPKPSIGPSTGAASSPKPGVAAKTSVRPEAKKLQHVSITLDSQGWEDIGAVVKDYGNLLNKTNGLVNEYNELVDHYHKLSEGMDVVIAGFRELETDYNELLAERDELAGNYDSLKDVVPKHGLDWWEGMPALRITDSEKATEWFKHALAYYADWNRLRLTGSDEEFKRANDEFYARWAEEKDSSESETPVTTDPAPEPGEPSAGPFPDGGERA
jgi:hypothetical protein